MTRSDDDVVQDYEEEEDETMEEYIMYPSSSRRRLWNRIWIVLGLSVTGALLMTLATMAAAHQSSFHSEQPEVEMYHHRDQSVSRSTRSSRNNSFPIAASSSRLHLFLLEHWYEYKKTKRRRLDEDAGGGGGAQQQDAQGNGNNNNNNSKQGDSNFYFDDFIQDDRVQDDDASGGGGNNNHNNNDVVDDFYAFEVDRTPHLLPLSSNTIFGFFIASLALSLGASSGTGGGGTITPIYILIIGLPIQVAVPIGAVTCLGGSLACTSLNLRRRHPLADRVLIDWDMILIMEPLTLVGALVGSLVHKVLSEKILVVLLVLLLSITAHTTLGKAMRMYHAENRYIRQLRKTYGGKSSTASIDGQHASAGGGKIGMAAKSPTYPKIQTWGTMDPAEAEAESLASDSLNQRNTSANNSLDLCSQRTLLVNNRNDNIDDSNNTSQKPYPPQTGSTGNGNHHGTPMSQRRQETARTRRLHDEEKEEILIENPDYITLRSELMEQEKFTPSSKIMALCGMLFIIIFLSLMVGGGSYESPWDIQCNSTAFWVVHAIMIAFLIGTAWAAQTYVVARHEIKEIVRFDYVHGDIKWDTRSAIIYPALFVTAGFFAGTLGIGGGGTFVYYCFLVLLLLVVNWSFSLCCCPLPSLFCFCLSCSGPQ
jgi:uncharacterized membrane protein YfcA